MKKYLNLLKQTFVEWTDDDVPRLAASISYYTALSLAPLLVLVIYIAGFFFGDEAARGQIVAQLGAELGPDIASFLEELIQNASRSSQGIISTFISFVMLIVAATGLFMQLQSALNQVWDIKVEKGGIRFMIQKRILSFGMIITLGFLLLISLLLNAVIASLDTFLVNIAPSFQVIIQAITFIISYLISMLLFSILFKYMPDAKIKWRDVMIGAAVTALLFNLGRFALGLYLGNVGIASSYGAAGSFVVVLVWVYYSAQIVMFGAEFTQVYARTYGTHITPEQGAQFETTRLLKDSDISRDELINHIEHLEKDAKPTPVTSLVQPEVKVVHHYPNEPMHTILISALTALSGALVGWIARQFIREK